ncbi:Alpha/Beta hydrolase protein [Aspergillus ambiguus]|uniref:alpha/beta hydrolase n=1 Tax=Aspergillus ambiguus TaxID=176160 RepID=UPI003CCCAF9D
MLRRWPSQRLGRQMIWTCRVRQTCWTPNTPLSRRDRETLHQGFRIRQGITGSRTLFTSVIPPLLVPPAMFVGLLLGLWAWKCFWIIVMQDKLLYLSWLPPFARSETVEDYMAECKPVQWVEKHFHSLDGTKLAVCEGRMPNVISSGSNRRSVVICYFQGNGGSTPMRLPLLSQILRTINDTKPTISSDAVDYTILALSYRGYWRSSGRSTQSGIERDAQAFLSWVTEMYSAPDVDLQVVLWGHSLGSAVASTALATYLSQRVNDEKPAQTATHISGMVMEAPTSSIKDMLISLYPQKWLPYRYLWPFSWNNWDSTEAFKRLARYRDAAPTTTSTRPASRLPPPILILSAENDEVIPPYVAGDLHRSGKALGLDVEWKEVPGAMHIEAPVKPDGRKALVEFLFKSTSPCHLREKMGQ